MIPSVTQHGPMRYRKLRIVWAVVCGIACLLLVGLPILGWCSWREATGKEIQAAFVNGVFSPIRAEYQSVTTPDQEAEIQQREEALKRELHNEAAIWRTVSVASFASTLAPLVGLWFLISTRK